MSVSNMEWIGGMENEMEYGGSPQASYYVSMALISPQRL